MSIASTLLLPLHAAAIFSGAKSFRHNPVLGSRRLNEKGLHVWRTRMAERMARWRQSRLRHLLDAETAAHLDRDGYAMVPNLLPADSFKRLMAEVEETRFPAREMKQGGTVTRFITLSPEVLADLPELRALTRNPLLHGALRFAAGFNHEPYLTLHTVITDPDGGAPDPQTHFHSDTFHATAKAWIFLRDVAEEDGPFSYVPGSHRLTPGRLAWEREQSLQAAQASNPHHALGSFRASPAELQAMDFPPAVTFPVPANTLVVADTHGFHARQPARRPSTRLALYGSVRANPFRPWAGLDPFRLPGLRGRRAQWLDTLRWAAAKASGKPEGQPLVGLTRPGDPAKR